MHINISRLIFCILMIWLLISSVYYIDAIFIGVGAVKDSENIYHKIIKYSVCFILSFSLLIWWKKLPALLWAIFFSVLAIFSVLDYQGVTIYATTMLIISTMLGFIYVIPIFHTHIDKINTTLLWTGVIVGIISILELTVFSSNMKSYWVATGGVRSISSLLNPTNSGAYAAVMIILALTSNIKSIVLKLLFIFMPLLTLVFSGSRTAWLSLALVMCFTPFMKDNASQKLRKFIPFMIFIGWISAAIFVYIYSLSFSGIESQYRGLNSYTASIRLENFMSYMSHFDMKMLWPDISDSNVALISDNFYLVMLNFFGVIGFFFLLLFVMLCVYTNFVTREIEPKISAELASWKIIFLYFIISGLSNSFINAFPVNQLFFISIGFFIYKSNWYKKLPHKIY